MHSPEIRSPALDEELRAAHDAEPVDGAQMLLTFIDLRGVAPAVEPDRLDPDGSVYADLVEQYRDALVPWARDDDQGAIITVLKTIGFTAFGSPVGGAGA